MTTLLTNEGTTIRTKDATFVAFIDNHGLFQHIAFHMGKAYKWFSNIYIQIPAKEMRGWEVVEY